MKRLIAGIALAGLVCGAQATEVYKCKDGNGRLVFSQKPCASDAEKIDVKVDSGLSDEFTKHELELIAARKVSIGMSEAALVRSWGKPDKINKSAYGSDQWVYGNNQYVYVEDGLVTNWQTME